VNEAITLRNIGLTYSTQGYPNRALTYLQQALNIQREIGNDNTTAATLTNIGAILYEQKEYKNAIPLLLESLYMHIKTGSPRAKYPQAYLNLIIEKIGKSRFNEIVQNQNQNKNHV